MTTMEGSLRERARISVLLLSLDPSAQSFQSAPTPNLKVSLLKPSAVTCKSLHITASQLPIKFQNFMTFTSRSMFSIFSCLQYPRWPSPFLASIAVTLFLKHTHCLSFLLHNLKITLQRFHKRARKVEELCCLGQPLSSMCTALHVSMMGPEKASFSN